jgi:predicted RNA-binding protein
MSVFIEENGEQKIIMENVTRLEAVEGDISVSSLFDEPVRVPTAFVKHIDFTGGKVLLSPSGGNNNG